MPTRGHVPRWEGNVRLKGQQKGGFYPAPAVAVDAALHHINATGAMLHVCDPCAGEGEALMQICRKLNAKPYAIELDEGRAEKLKMSAPDAVAPASAFGVKCQGYFDMLWLNPPYDDEMGGGNRVEQEFLQSCSPWLKPGGLLCFVVPEHIIGQYSPAVTYLRERYDECRWMPFPYTCRRFREVVVFGYKRSSIRELDYKEKYNANPPEPITDPDLRWHVKPGHGPRVFEKSALTDKELQERLATSALQKLLQPPPPLVLPRPPLPVAKGHLAMLLASGHMDGLVSPDGEVPHVVRGTATKVPYLKESTEDIKSDGSITTREVYSEKVVLTIRALTSEGKIVNLSGG